MSIEKHCPGCGAVVSPGQPACTRCGRSLADLWATVSAPLGGTAGFGVPGAPQPTPPAMPAAGMIQQGSSQRPWPFAPEILAERLVVAGYLQKPVADALLAEAQASGRSLVDVIRERKALAPEALRDAMARIFGLPVANLQAIHIDPTLIASFPSDLAREHMLLPLHREGDRLVTVVADPTQAETIRTVRRTVGLTIDLRLATLEELAPVVHQYFSPRLVALLPSGETLDIVIPPGELKIGRAEHNEIVLPDPTVGSSHAILRASGQGYQIVDFGSRNGVFVDGKKIQGQQTLKNGDVIQIGQCLLTFKLPIPDAAQSHDGATQLLSPQKIIAAAPIIQASGAVRSPFVPPTPAAGMPVVEDDDDRKKDKKKKKKDSKAKEGEKLKSAWIGFIGRIIAQVVGAAATIILGLAVAGKLPTSCGVAGSNESVDTKSMENASGIVPIGDGQFIICNNNVAEELFKLTLKPDGTVDGGLTPMLLGGVAKGQLDDLEALALADEGGQRFIIGSTSLYRNESKKKGQFGPAPSGLVRVRLNQDGSLAADTIPNFREWFLSNVKDLVPAAAIEEPDGEGLNVEGLAWDPINHRLLFGLRTPTAAREHKVLVVPVRVNDLAGAWDASNLTVEPTIRLAVDDSGGEAGIRSLDWDPVRKAFLVIVGNATSDSKAPFQLYQWDGNAEGRMARFANLSFDKKMKPEGITHATIGGKGALVVADDAGSFQVIWDTDPRLN